MVPAAMLGSALLLALSGCTSLDGQRGNAPVLHHAIDGAAWTIPDIIRWPQGSDSVTVVFNADGRFSPCGTPLKPAAIARMQTAEVEFGTACQRLFVLFMPAPTVDTPGDRALAAAHEAFHQAVQYNGLRPLLNRVELPDDLSTAQFASLKRFLERLFDVLRSPDAAVATCQLFHRDFIALSEDEQRYLLYKAYWEWPAEHYMRAAVMPDADFEEYVQARRRIGRDGEANILYTTGIAAFGVIERHVPRSDWQRAYVDGETPVNLLMAASGCRPLHGASLQVDMKLDNVFVE